ALLPGRPLLLSVQTPLLRPPRIMLRRALRRAANLRLRLTRSALLPGRPLLLSVQTPLLRPPRTLLAAPQTRQSDHRLTQSARHCSPSRNATYNSEAQEPIPRIRVICLRRPRVPRISSISPPQASSRTETRAPWKAVELELTRIRSWKKKTRIPSWKKKRRHPAGALRAAASVVYTTLLASPRRRSGRPRPVPPGIQQPQARLLPLHLPAMTRLLPATPLRHQRSTTYLPARMSRARSQPLERTLPRQTAPLPPRYRLARPRQATALLRQRTAHQIRLLQTRTLLQARAPRARTSRLARPPQTRTLLQARGPRPRTSRPTRVPQARRVLQARAPRARMSRLARPPQTRTPLQARVPRARMSRLARA
ncbi:hypothetical protein OC842_008022, partial [Tilletia horrida]